VGEINVPEHIWKAWPSVPTASTVPTLLKVLVVSGKPFVIACTRTEDELTIRTKAANSELSLLPFDVIGIPFYIFSQDFGSWADGIALDKSRLCAEGFVGRWVLVHGPGFHFILLRAGCTVRATLGFRCGNINAWKLYCGSAKRQKKVNAANPLRLNGLGATPG